MRYQTTNMFHEPFWLISNLAQWTQFVVALMEAYFDQIIMFLANQALEIIGQKGITLKVLTIFYGLHLSEQGQ